MHHPSIDTGDTTLDEQTHLISTETSINTSTSTNHQQYEHAQNILLATTLSRFGSRSWEFVTPLLLLEWSPNSLIAPAIFGLSKSCCNALISPILGRRADSWGRYNTVLVGAGMQGIGCLVSIIALMLWNYISTSSLDTSGDGETNDYTMNARYVMGHLLSLTLVIIAGIIEALGAQLASVAVKKEWVPIVFKDDTATNNEQDLGKRKILSFLCFDINYPNISLGFINTSMTNIDLTAAMFGPILSGWILQVMGNDDVTTSMQRGFVVVALFNIISFVPEALLLRRVYNSCSELHQRGDNEVTINTNETTTESSSSVNKEEQTARSSWSVWYHHPSGLPLLTVSLASLYLTALSPSGVVLTSYLVMVGMTPKSIGIFRAVGALSGVTGLGLFSIARHWGEDDYIGFEYENEDAMRSSSAKSVEQLRRVSLAFLLLEVASVLMAAYSFSHIESFDMMDQSSELPWHVALFLGSICVSRAGLYSFDIGALEIQQYIVDERYRNAVGSVEGALCSLVEMGMYLLSILLPNPSQFGVQVGVSATAVSFRYVWMILDFVHMMCHFFTLLTNIYFLPNPSGVCFSTFLYRYLMHGHHHHNEEELDGDISCHNHHSHSHHHPHTAQQEKDLQKYNGYHIHLHRHGDNINCRLPLSATNRRTAMSDRRPCYFQ